MIGDPEWQDLMTEAYHQYLADSARLDREPQVYARWAVERTWRDFVRLAVLVLALPPFALSDWETKNPVPATGNGFRSVDLARRLISGLVLVRALLQDMKRSERSAYRAVKYHLDEGRCPVGTEHDLADGKRFIWEWLQIRCNATQSVI